MSAIPREEFSLQWEAARVARGKALSPAMPSSDSHGCTAEPCQEPVSAKGEGKRCRGNCGEGSPSSNRLLSGTTAWSLHHSQPRPMVPHLGFETPNVCFHPSHIRALRQACATVSASVPTSTSHLRSPSSFLSLVSALLKALHHSPSSLGPNMDAICRATMHGMESAEGCTEGWEGY